MSTNQKQIISNYQIATLVCSLLAVSAMLSFPMAMTETSAQDAIFSYFYPLLYYIPFAFFLYKLARRVPGKNMFEIANHLCGRAIGGVLNAILILFLFYDLALNLRIYADYFHSSILLHTPVEIIIISTVGLLVFFGNGSVESLARTNDIFFPFAFFIFFMLPLLLLNEIDLTQLQPVLSGGWIRPFHGGLLGIGAFGDILAMGAFMNYVKDPRGLYIALKSGIILSALTLTMWMLLVITVLSPKTASKIIYIGWILVQQIRITDFLDRLDLFVISLWLPLLFIKYCIIYLAVLTGLASFTKAKNHKLFNNVAGLLLTVVAVVLFSNVMQVIKLNTYWLVPVILVVHILFFAVLFIYMWRRKETVKKNRERRRYRYSFLLALAGCLAAIWFGGYYGPLRGIYGNISIISYIIFLLLAVYLSVREFLNVDKLISNK